MNRSGKALLLALAALAATPAASQDWNCGAGNCWSQAAEILPAVADPGAAACLYPGPACAQALGLPAAGNKSPTTGGFGSSAQRHAQAQLAAARLVDVLGPGMNLSSEIQRPASGSLEGLAFSKPAAAGGNIRKDAKTQGPNPLDKVKLKQGPLQNVDTERMKEILKGSRQMSSN